MSIVRLGLFALLLGASSPSSAAGVDAIAEVGPFQFEQGGGIADMRVGYCLHGLLNAARDNAILLLPPTSGTRHSYDALIGPGKAFDTERFMVITVDPIGGGLSSKPSDGLRDSFPHYTIRDMVAAEERLVHSVLKLDHLRVVAGASMGSFQALEWAVRYPDSTDRLVLVAPAARSDAHLRSIVDGMAAILDGDGERWDARPRLRAAAALFMPWLRSDAYLVRRGEAANRGEVGELASSWARDWDALDLLYRYRASAGHDVGVPFGGSVQSALARIKATTLVVRVSSDRVVPPYLTEELQRALPAAREVRVDTDAGHSAFLAPADSRDAKAIWQPVKSFIEASAI